MEIIDLNEEDLNGLNHEIALGQKILGFYIDREWDGQLKTLDEALQLWLNDPREQKPTENDIALGLGSLTGEYLRSKHKCRWVLVKDNTGIELGMINDKSGWQIFPRHWIAKRVNTEDINEMNMIESIINTLIREGHIDH